MLQTQHKQRACDNCRMLFVVICKVVNPTFQSISKKWFMFKVVNTIDT